jgi:hypothetical protein
VTVVLYDTTTLHFEAEDEDEPLLVGMSNYVEVLPSADGDRENDALGPKPSAVPLLSCVSLWHWQFLDFPDGAMYRLESFQADMC